MDFQHWLHEAVNQLRDSDSPRRDAEILLEYVTGKGRTYIMALAKRRYRRPATTARGPAAAA